MSCKIYDHKNVSNKIKNIFEGNADYIEHYVVLPDSIVDNIKNKTKNINWNLNDAHVRDKNTQKQYAKNGYFGEYAVKLISDKYDLGIERYDENEEWKFDMYLNNGKNIEVKTAQQKSQGQNIPMRAKEEYSNMYNSKLIRNCFTNDGDIADYLIHTIVAEHNGDIIVGVTGISDMQDVIISGDTIDIRRHNQGVYFPINTFDELKNNLLSIKLSPDLYN